MLYPGPATLWRGKLLLASPRDPKALEAFFLSPLLLRREVATMHSLKFQGKGKQDTRHLKTGMVRGGGALWWHLKRKMHRPMAADFLVYLGCHLKWKENLKSLMLCKFKVLCKCSTQTQCNHQEFRVHRKSRENKPSSCKSFNCYRGHDTFFLTHTRVKVR